MKDAASRKIASAQPFLLLNLAITAQPYVVYEQVCERVAL